MAQLGTAPPMANLLVPLDQKFSQKIKEEAKDQDATEERTPVGHHSDVVQEFKTEPRTPEPSALLDSKMANSSLAQDTKSILYHLPEKPTFFASSGTVKGVNASISSSTETETVVETTPMLTGSPKRVSHDWPIPSKESNLPALLLRMGPAVTGWDTAPTRLPSTISSASSHSHLPSRPSVDSWVAPDVSLGAMPSARLQRDSYIAPRSPSPPRSGRAGSQARRNEHSPVRIRHREGRGEDRSESGWGEDVSRKRMQAGSWREEHLPPKRRRSDVDGFGDELRARPYDAWEPRRDVGSRSNEELGTPYHDSEDHRHQHHRRESSLDRRSHREGRAASEERRGTRYVDHQEDRRARGGVEGRRDTRNGDSGTSNSDVRDKRARYVNGGEEVRVLISDRSPRGSERRPFADEQYGKQSDNTDRGTGRRLQIRDHPTQVDKADDRDHRRPYADDRSREPVTMSKERERSPRKEHADDRRFYAEDRPKETIVSTRTDRESSPRKEYEGGRAQLTTSNRNGVTSVDNSNRNYVAVNGNDQHAESKPKTLPPTGPTAQINAARAVPYPRPGAVNNVRNQRPIPQALSFRRGGSMSSTRSATTGSNTEPITARRGFEIPQASASPVIAQTPIKTPKDTLSPPLQDQDYIINSFAELKNMVKPLWIENPKQPMANFLTGGKGGANGLGPRGPAYRIQTGRLGGRNITRAILPIVGHPSIRGVGDDPVRVQAEKLACLSALFQLVEAGLMKGEEQPTTATAESPESADADDFDSEEVTQLSTGETITLREARSFMDYYCKRFGFGQPEITYETVAMRAGPQKWEAIMEVGGKKIGLGAGTTKKMATRVCFLDVCSYLEKCDPALWREYLEYVKTQGN